MEKGRTWLWILLVAAVVMGAVWQFYPLPDASERLSSLPLLGKGYIGRNLPLTDFERDTFVNVNLLKRLYRVGPQNLFITALDGTRNRHIVHDPFYCFRGGGWELVSQKIVPMPNGQAALLQMKNDDKTQEAMYWFSDGKEQYASPMRYWLQATWRRLTLGRSGPEPVLIVVQPVDNQSFDAQALFKTFPELLKL